MLKVGSFRLLALIWVLVAATNCSPQPNDTQPVPTPTYIRVRFQAYRPEFLGAIYPAPDSTQSADVYASTIEWGSGEWNSPAVALNRAPNTICIELKTRHLPGTPDVTLGDSKIQLLAIQQKSQITLRRGDLFVIVQDITPVGESVMYCWLADLTPDTYEATYIISPTPSYVLSYTWSFEITE